MTAITLPRSLGPAILLMAMAFDESMAQTSQLSNHLGQGFEICEAWLSAPPTAGSVASNLGWRRTSPESVPTDVSITFSAAPGDDGADYIVLTALRFVHATQRSCNLVVRFEASNDPGIIGAPRRLLEGAGFLASPHRSSWQDELWSRAEGNSVDIAAYVFGPTSDFSRSSVGLQVGRTIVGSTAN